MNWSDEGIVLSASNYGENSLIVSMITSNRGLHAGFVKGGSGKRMRGVFEPGNLIVANWQARLEEHLGMFKCELLEANAALFFNHPLKLAGLSSICAVVECSLQEREPHPKFYKRFKKFINEFDSIDWLHRYVILEVNLLSEIGFGLDLETCAVTGTTRQLVYVSPKTGRAVSKNAGEPYHDRMLVLPQFLSPSCLNEGAVKSRDVCEGLTLTGHFLQKHVFFQREQNEPAARTRFIERLQQSPTICST